MTAQESVASGIRPVLSVLNHVAVSFQRPDDAVQELVEHRDADAREHHLREVAALLARDEDVGAGRAFRVRQVAVLLDDERPAERDHEEDAERSPDRREEEDDAST